MSLTPPPDRLCQWCHRVLAVGLKDGGWMTVASTTEFEGALYCSGVSGTCWDDLIAMTKFVKDNFHD